MTSRNLEDRMKYNFIFILTCQLLLSVKPVYSCICIYAVQDSVVLVGNNEDWTNPFTKVWFYPSDNKNFGRVYFGFAEYSQQGGMNDQGLFIDGFATKFQKMTKITKESYSGNYQVLLEQILSKCKDVGEAVKIFDAYYFPFLEHAMIIIGDKEGKSAIIEGDTIIYKSGRYQVVTNFRQSNIYNLRESHCWRFAKADSMLKLNKNISMDLFKEILSATSQEFTQYSNINDLKNGLIRLYHYYNFDSVVVINLKEELQKGEHSYDLPGLFTVTDTRMDFRASYPEYYDKSNSSLPVFAKVGVCIAIAILSYFIIFKKF